MGKVGSLEFHSSDIHHSVPVFQIEWRDRDVAVKRLKVKKDAPVLAFETEIRLIAPLDSRYLVQL